MEEAKTSDELVAAASDVDRSTISRIRRGKRYPSVSLIKKIIEYSGILVRQGKAPRALEANDFVDFPACRVKSTANGNPRR